MRAATTHQGLDDYAHSATTTPIYSPMPRLAGQIRRGARGRPGSLDIKPARARVCANGGHSEDRVWPLG